MTSWDIIDSYTRIVTPVISRANIVIPPTITRSVVSILIVIPSEKITINSMPVPLRKNYGAFIRLVERLAGAKPPTADRDLLSLPK